MLILGAPTLDDALNALAVRIRAAEERGEKNFIFCEDRLTLLTERAVLEAAGGATFLSEVSTFARFLSGEKKVLSKEGSVMALSAVMQEREQELSCFHESQAGAVYETVAQLLSSRVDAQMLKSSAETAEGTLRRKIDDLALLLDEYQKFLSEGGFVDENGYLSYLPEKIGAGALDGYNVYFFAFPSFTAQAREGVRAAVLHAKSVTGIFLAGKESFYTNEGARVFRSVLEEFGTPECKMLKGSLSGEAKELAGRLFSPERAGGQKLAAEHIRMFRAADELEEANRVCALLKERVRAGLRYRDIAVLADGDDLSVFEKTFTQYRIPYYADVKRSFARHPFCAFVLSVLQGAADGVTPDTADEILSSVYFGDGDEYRNYLLRYGCYRGAYNREIREGEAVKRFSRAALVSSREKLRAIVKLFPRRATGNDYLAAIEKLRGLVGEERITKELAETFEGAEKQFLLSDALARALGDISLVAGERKFTAQKFRMLLESGLKALTVSLIPQSVDAVFLGDLAESKLKRVKVLFCASLTDAFPRVTGDTAVIDDNEISRLKELSVEIEPAIAVVNSRSRESLALNLVSFSDELFLSYPVKRGGAEQNKSEILFDCESAFSMPAEGDVFPLDCCEEAPATLALSLLKDEFEQGLQSDPVRYASLCEALERAGVPCAGRREEQRVARAGELWFSYDVSPTLLEDYFFCPYKSFVDRGLKMRSREEGAVPAADAGSFVHAVLESVAGEFNRLTSEEECRAVTRERATALLTTPKYAPLADTAEGRYAGGRLVSECEEASAAAYRQLAQSGFRVRETEGKIVYKELSLSGKADRVDEAGSFVRVIDYKTGTVDDSPLSYYTGRKLQLQLYLSAAAAGGEPAGAFYFPAQESYTKPDEEKYKLKGFFRADDEVLSLMDTVREEGKKSAFFEGGGRSEKGMSGEDFNDFLSYSALVVRKAEGEMKAGNIAPSPYESCSYCNYKGMCAFVGQPRREKSVSCKEIVKIVRRERGEE